MNSTQTKSAHALYLRVCAEVLRSGNDEAQAVAETMVKQAEEIEQRVRQQEQQQ